MEAPQKNRRKLRKNNQIIEEDSFVEPISMDENEGLNRKTR
jgi:hypothetical protein